MKVDYRQVVSELEQAIKDIDAAIASTPNSFSAQRSLLKSHRSRLAAALRANGELVGTVGDASHKAAAKPSGAKSGTVLKSRVTSSTKENATMRTVNTKSGAAKKSSTIAGGVKLGAPVESAAHASEPKAHRPVYCDFGYGEDGSFTMVAAGMGWCAKKPIYRATYRLDTTWVEFYSYDNRSGEHTMVVTEALLLSLLGTKTYGQMWVDCSNDEPITVDVVADADYLVRYGTIKEVAE